MGGGQTTHLRGCATRSEGGTSPTSHYDNEPQPWLRTPSLRSVPRYVSPSSGHAILCSQGKWGRGAHPLVYTGVVLSQVSEGGLKVRIFYFLASSVHHASGGTTGRKQT